MGDCDEDDRLLRRSPVRALCTAETTDALALTNTALTDAGYNPSAETHPADDVLGESVIELQTPAITTL